MRGVKVIHLTYSPTSDCLILLYVLLPASHMNFIDILQLQLLHSQNTAISWLWGGHWRCHAAERMRDLSLRVRKSLYVRLSRDVAFQRTTLGLCMLRTITLGDILETTPCHSVRPDLETSIADRKSGQNSNYVARHSCSSSLMIVAQLAIDNQPTTCNHGECC